MVGSRGWWGGWGLGWWGQGVVGLGVVGAKG